MNAFGIGGRHLRIFGTEGELYAGMGDDEIIVRTFADWKDCKIPVNTIDESILSGHGGGDQGLVLEAYEYFNGEYDGYRAADIDVSVKNHFIAFAAEKSRKLSTVIKLDELCSEYDIKL